MKTKTRGFLALAVGSVLTLNIGVTSISDANSTISSVHCVQMGPQAKANCKLVVDFYEAFFNRHDVTVAERALAANYVQHNPDLPDGRSALVDFFRGYFEEHPQARSQILRVSASGDLVWLHIHDTEGAGERGNAVVDIFRVQKRQIVEHWDVVQQVPATGANNHLMF